MEDRGMKPISDFATRDMAAARFGIDAEGAIAEGYFADQLDGARQLAEALEPIPYTITAKGRELLEGK